MKESVRSIVASNAAIQDLRRQIIQLNSEQPDGWRSTFIKLRKSLAGELGGMGDLLRGWRESPNDDIDLVRDQLSKLRTALAELQSRWPAVSAAPDNASYKASVESLDHAYVDLNHSIERLARD